MSFGTNAVKYGALSNDSGCVEISWEPQAQSDRVLVCWRESGGPKVEPPEHQGFGSRLIQRAMEGGLGKAQLDFHPQGLACCLKSRYTGNGAVASAAAVTRLVTTL